MSAATSTARSLSSKIPRRKQSDGFALLVTITLLAFLVLLLVSLASLTKVETQVATNSQHVAQARQNALLALNLALGQLQKHAGPDQRVTATADLQPLATVADPAPYPVNDPASGVGLNGAAAVTRANIDTFWRNRRNRRWTGIWLNGNGAPYDPAKPADFNPVPQLKSWLVSGNENSATGDTFKPGDTISGLSETSTPLEEIRDASGRPYRLLVKTSAGVVASGDLDRAVTAPQVAITAGNISGLSGPQTIGHYAWWVGDEGVKARANLDDPYLGDNVEDARLTRFQSAQRSAVEVLSSDFSFLDPSAHDGSAVALKKYRDELEKVLSTEQLGYLSPTPAASTEFKNRFHDVTIWSQGVLSDARHGGLKSDLTYVLSQPDLNAFRTALRVAYGNNNVASESTFNPAINTVSTPYAELPGNVSNASPYNAGVGILGASTTWEQLWSFYHLGAAPSGSAPGVFETPTRAVSRRHTATQHGLHPIVVQAKLFYRLRIVGGLPDPDGVNRTGTLYVDTIPQVVLANPYPVDLAVADYQLSITGAAPRLIYLNSDNPSDAEVASATPANSGGDPVFNGRVRYVLRSQNGIPAGEARVFMIDPNPAINPALDTEERILLSSANDDRLVVMTDEYDPFPALTYNTGRRIPPANTRAAMRSVPGQLNTLLYMDNAATPGGSGNTHQNLIQFVRFQSYSVDLSTGSNPFLIVDPVADGVRHGGGYILVFTQPPTSDNPATTNPTRLFSHLQAPFYQMNYRGLVSVNVGNPPNGIQGVVETARTFSKNGATVPAGDDPNRWLAANLLRRSGSTNTVRWGLVNVGEGQEQTVPPNSIGGASASDIGFKNFLYDVPRPGRVLSSLGQLQHLSPSGFVPPGVTNFEASAPTRNPIAVNGWQVNYPVSNSYPHPRVLRQDVFGALPEHSYHYDGSYLWNDVLWDRFYFSTFPQSGPFDFDSDSDRLTNSRYRPFRDVQTVPSNDVASFRGDGNPSNAANSRIAAQNLLNAGAFNINSTSFEAWKVFFSSLKNVPVGTHDDTSFPFARTLKPGGDSAGSETGSTSNSWNGFRDLSAPEIEALAEEMVLQVRKRGPFLGLADFINRRLVPGRTSTAVTSNDPHGLGLSGALQAALDRAVNLPGNIDPNFRVQAKGFVRMENAGNNVNHNATRDFDYRMPNALVGFPGHLLQGDVLSALGPTITARSDTFTIRTYGDAVNPATNEVTGRAWCEAVVQRTPDYVDSTANAPHEIPAAGTPNATFGRRFQIVSFRWLGPEDI